MVASTLMVSLDERLAHLSASWHSCSRRCLHSSGILPHKQCFFPCVQVQRAAATALLMIAMLQYLSAAGSLCDAQEHHSAHMHLSHQDTAAAGRHCYEAQQLATMQLMQWRYLHPAINSTAATQQAVQQGSSASSAGKKHSMHLERPINATVAASRRALQRYLSGRRFVTLHDSMLEQQQRHSRRGILIAAGGKVLLAQVVVLLKVRALCSLVHVRPAHEKVNQIPRTV